MELPSALRMKVLSVSEKLVIKAQSSSGKKIRPAFPFFNRKAQKLCHFFLPEVFFSSTMKKKISTYEELLLSLAVKGDPTAFYSIANSYFKERYFKLREENNSPEETAKNLLPLSGKLFRSFQESRPENFEKWFRGSLGFSDDIEYNLEAYQHLETEYSLFQKELQTYLMKFCIAKSK